MVYPVTLRTRTWQSIVSRVDPQFNEDRYYHTEYRFSGSGRKVHREFKRDMRQSNIYTSDE